MADEPRRVTIAGGTVWIGLMLFVIALNTCGLDASLSGIERALERLDALSSEGEGGPQDKPWSSMPTV